MVASNDEGPPNDEGPRKGFPSPHSPENGVSRFDRLVVVIWQELHRNDQHI